MRKVTFTIDALEHLEEWKFADPKMIQKSYHWLLKPHRIHLPEPENQNF